MPQKKFHLDKLDYEKKLKRAIIETGGEMLKAENLSEYEGIDVYHFGRFRTTLVYHENKAVIIGSADVHIKRTKSKLEEISGVKLTEIR